MAIYIFQSVIRGHHISKTVWTPRFGEELTVEKEADNAHDRHAVAVLPDLFVNVLFLRPKPSLLPSIANSHGFATLQDSNPKKTFRSFN